MQPWKNWSKFRNSTAASLALLLIPAFPAAAWADDGETCAAIEPLSLEPYDRFVDETHYAATRWTGLGDTLDSLDVLGMEPFHLPPEDPPVRGEPVELVENVAEELVDDVEPALTLLKPVLHLAEGSTPTLRTRIHITEKSYHQDRWFFEVSVKAFCGETQLGAARQELPVKDHYARSDTGPYKLDVPIKDLAVNVGEIEVLAVRLYASWCEIGWVTKKTYQCQIDSDFTDGVLNDNIQVYWDL